MALLYGPAAFRKRANAEVWGETGREDEIDAIIARGNLRPKHDSQPRNVQRADIAPTDGYALVVDGHVKTQFAEKAAATKAATELLAKYPMLQVEIYDASSKSRTLVK